MDNWDLVDAHFHVWDLEKFKYDWPTPDMKIYQNYYPCGIETASADTPVQHGIFVQCLNGHKEEAEWVIYLASRHPFIVGVVADLDLTDQGLEETIKSLMPSGLLKGSRHILDVENDDWITRDDVSNVLDVLEKYNLTFDLLVRPNHLKYIPQVVSKHPKLKFIINHIAKPPVLERKLEGWQEDMSAIASYQNVYCKLSALISEQSPETWKEIKFEPFDGHVLKVFTPDRIVFGPDWPVFGMVDASYMENFKLLQKLTTALSDGDKNKIFRENAINFYNLTL